MAQHGNSFTYSRMRRVFPLFAPAMTRRRPKDSIFHYCQTAFVSVIMRQVLTMARYGSDELELHYQQDGSACLQPRTAAEEHMRRRAFTLIELLVVIAIIAI